MAFVNRPLRNCRSSINLGQSRARTQPHGLKGQAYERLSYREWASNICAPGKSVGKSERGHTAVCLGTLNRYQLPNLGKKQ